MCQWTLRSRVDKMRVGFVILAVLGFAAADKQEVATISLCDDVDQSQCTVNEVRINPCKPPPHPCQFKKEKNATLEFDFTPNFNANNLKTGVYWTTGDVPFAGFGSDDACLYTTCPTVSGTKQLYKYNLYLGKKLPTGTFQVKWRVWNKDNEAEKCCFMTKFVIKRNKNKIKK